MMGASRMGFNLWTKGGWRNLWMTRNYRAFRLSYKDVFLDTVMPAVCFFLGHKPYDANAPWQPVEWACRRCRQYLREIGR